MQVYLNKANLTIPVSGKTGYNNQSSLVINTKEFDLILASDRKIWDISHIDWSLIDVVSVHLEIPTGEFGLYEDITVEVDSDNKEITFKGKAVWDGIQAGLQAGMSGYANFGFIPDETIVIKGVYLPEKDVFDFSGNVTTLPQYNNAITNSRSLFNNGEITIQDMERHVATEGTDPEWEQWLKYVYSDEATQTRLQTRLAQQKIEAEHSASRRKRRKRFSK